MSKSCLWWVVVVLEVGVDFELEMMTLQVCTLRKNALIESN